MPQKKEGTEEEFVFEFYDEDYSKSLEDIEKSVAIEEYNEIDFEADLNEEQLEIVNNIQGPGSSKLGTFRIDINRKSNAT